jgi:hypothetical protein
MVATAGPMARAGRPRTAGILLLLATAIAMPVFLSDFQLFRLTNILIYAIALLGINIVSGCNGQVSLGTARSTRSALTRRPFSLRSSRSRAG